MNAQDHIDEGALKAYLDDALPASEREEMTAHLSECDTCQSRLSELRTLGTEVGGLLGSYLQAPDANAAFAKMASALPATSAASLVHTNNRRVAELPTVARGQAAARTTAAWRPRRSVLAAVGLGLAATVVLVFWSAGLIGLHPLTLLTPSVGGEFVPSHMVRHIVYEIKQETSVGGVVTPTTRTSEVWLANGSEHMLMFATEWDNLSATSQPTLKLINDEAVWTYKRIEWRLLPAPAPTAGPDGRVDVVLKSSYDSRHLTEYFPGSSAYDSFMQLANAYVSGSEVIGRRDTIIAESTGNVAGVVGMHGSEHGPLVIVRAEWPSRESGVVWGLRKGVYNVEGTPVNGEGTPVTQPTVGIGVRLNVTAPDAIFLSVDYKIWFDKETYRVMQEQSISRAYKDGEVTNTVVQTRKLTKDELLSEVEVSPDLFKPHPGVFVVDSGYEFYQPYVPMPPATLVGTAIPR